MKRLALLLVIMLAATSVGCQTLTIVGSTVIVAWDAPDLTGIPANEVSYEVYVAPFPGGLGPLVATVTTLESPITFAVEGRYRIGVRTKRTVVDVGDTYSAIAWSDVMGSPAPWYAAYIQAPNPVVRIRIK